MKVRANGIEVNYELAGEGDCLVLIHGAGDSLGMWRDQVSALSGRFRVLTYDIRGFGGTELPDGDVGVDGLAADLRELLRALDIESAYLVGYSMGGRIALQLAVETPVMVRALVLANSGVAPASPEGRERRRVLIEALERGDAASVAERMTELSFSPGLRERDPALFQRYREIKLANKPRSFARVWSAVMQSPPPDVSRLACPVLIIAGERDSFVPLASARATQGSIRGSRLEILPTGHAAALEAPAEFNELVLDFLSQLDGNRHD